MKRESMAGNDNLPTALSIIVVLRITRLEIRIDLLRAIEESVQDGLFQQLLGIK